MTILNHAHDESSQRWHLLIAAPVLPGKSEAWRRFVQELRGSQHVQGATAWRRLGITQQAVWLVPTAFGDMAIVALESQHPAQLLAELGTGHCEFDLWLRDQLLALHGVDVQQLYILESAELIYRWPMDP